jgi:hypothetical protein
MRGFSVLAAIMLAIAPLPALAAPKDAVLNKEGYWGIDVDNDACAASMTLQGGAIFLLRAQGGKVTFGLFALKPLARGKAGRIETEAYGFDFKPSYDGDASTLYYNGDLDARALAALRLAKQARILVDGRPIQAMTLEGTGFEAALDGVIGCSNGESGWWGKGVGAEVVEDGGAALHKDGVWQIAAADTPGICMASANAADGYTFTVFAEAGVLAFGVGSDKNMRKGRKGRLQTDAFSLDFKPTYDNANFFYSEDLDSQSAFALRRAKAVAISIDGKPLVDMSFEGSGYAEVLNDLAACAAGEKGWWGEGAKKP